MSSKDAESKENKSPNRRNFLKVAVTFSALLVVAGIGAIAKAVTSTPPSESSATATFPRVKVAT
ncbi:MAG TPA: hypothetical protein VE862_04640, partial [Candidatus Acidoferrum sp.]|nr:hypothetical protein [Candidatus Acidoferrum sp.]